MGWSGEPCADPRKLLDARSEHRSSVYVEHAFNDALALQNRTVIVSVRPVARRECERRKAAGLTRARAHTLEDELSGVRPSSRDPQLARRPPASADDALDPGGKFKLLMIAAY